MIKPRFRLAYREATSLLQKAGQVAPPVDVEKIASEELGAEIIRRKGVRSESSGGVKIADGRIIIAVNYSHPLTRRRFTIAHEIGHIVMHASTELHFDRDFTYEAARDGRSSLAVDRSEIEANSFAGHLLMPGNWLRDEIDKNGGFDIEHDEDFVDRLAKKYQVSRQAMTIRLAKLVGFEFR